MYLPGGRTAILRFKDHYFRLPAAYADLYGTWLPNSGQEAEHSPVFENHLNSPADTAPEDLLSEICLPITQ